MKAPSLVTLASLAALVAVLAVTVRQRSQAGGLRQEVEDLTRAQAAAASAVEPAPAPPVPPPAEAAPLSTEERRELARLRSDVTRLRREVKGLDALQQENASLNERLATARANPSSLQAALPPGYILRRTARNAGQATLEATVETFLWAVEHRDLNTMLQTLVPEDAQKLAKAMEQQGADFWQGAAKLPGMRITDQKPLPDGSMELKLGIELEGSSVDKPTKARQVDGLWRLELR